MHKTDIAAELGAEREALIRAEQDILDGAERLRRQREVVLEMRLEGVEAGQAMRLEQLLDETLTEWVTHRDLIRHRVAHLERALASSS